MRNLAHGRCPGKGTERTGVAPEAEPLAERGQAVELPGRPRIGAAPPQRHERPGAAGVELDPGQGLGAEGGLTLAEGAARARSEIAQLEREYGLEVDLDTKVADLPVGVQQRVEILKALFRGARILILDEPTSALTEREVEILFSLLK
ncbi:MAG: ATP-binding cassette domain-containing protein, partial [Geminicoccaceae bacterium]